MSCRQRSVRLSQVGVLLKRLNVGSHDRKFITLTLVVCSALAMMQRIARVCQRLLILVRIRDKSSLNFTQYALLPHNIDVLVCPQITVTSLYHVCIYPGYSGSIPN